MQLSFLSSGSQKAISRKSPDPCTLIRGNPDHLGGGDQGARGPETRRSPGVIRVIRVFRAFLRQNFLEDFLRSRRLNHPLLLMHF